MNILSIDNVTIKFPESNYPALNGFSYDISRGDFVILLGSNGSGKSTLLKLLHREHVADSGKITFMSTHIHSYNNEEYSQHVAVLTQNCSDSLFTSLTVYENYLLAANNNKTDRQFFIDYISNYNVNLTSKLNVIVANLSGGEKQALALALRFLNPPSLLLLDEHTSALDPKTSKQIMELTKTMIKKHNITCILTTHNLDIAMQYGNRILVLTEGKVKLCINQDHKHQLTKEEIISSCF